MPAEQLRAISCLKPNVLQLQSADPGPVTVFPWVRMIDKELIEEAAQFHHQRTASSGQLKSWLLFATCYSLFAR